MALWLELIPKIHRSDALDRRFHLLDDYDNETTFESDGTRRALVDDQPAVEQPYFTAASPSTASSSVTSASTHPALSSAVRRVRVTARRGLTSPRAATTPAARGRESKSGGLAVVELATANVPLSVTVAVGCTLLLLNVVVFVVVCRQKRRAAARYRSRDELKYGGGGDTESAGFDRNHSSVSSYSLAASVGQHGSDYGRCRNVRFSEAGAGPRAPVMTSQDGGASVFATRRLPPRPGRENEATDDCLEGEMATGTVNHLNNPSTTV